MANYSEEQLKTLKVSFEKYDEDKSGAIEKDELKKLLTGLGISKNETEIDDLFNNFDKDKSGSIEFEEFVDLVRKLDWK